MLHILGQSEAFYPCHRLSMTFGPLYMSYFGFHWAAKKNRSFKCLDEKLVSMETMWKFLNVGEL